MIQAIGELPAFWTIAVALALLGGQHWRVVRQRAATNQALHELRRPLQTLALAAPEQPVRASAPAAGKALFSVNPLWQVVRAVAELDRTVNGGPRPGEKRDLVACQLMSDACVRRCRPRASLAGARIRLRWVGPDALVRGDAAALAAALENLLINAIEHGGPEITVNALTVARRLRIEVIDSGSRAEAPGRRGLWRSQTGALGSPLGLAGLGDGRHGHGLNVARQAARDHGGKFNLEVSERLCRATLVLPVGGQVETRVPAGRAEP